MARTFSMLANVLEKVCTWANNVYSADLGWSALKVFIRSNWLIMLTKISILIVLILSRKRIISSDCSYEFVHFSLQFHWFFLQSSVPRSITFRIAMSSWWSLYTWIVSDHTAILISVLLYVLFPSLWLLLRFSSFTFYLYRLFSAIYLWWVLLLFSSCSCCGFRIAIKFRKFWPLFLHIYFLSPLPQDSSHSCSYGCLKLPQALCPWHYFLILFFSLGFILDCFHGPVLRFTIFSFRMSNATQCSFHL